MGKKKEPGRNDLEATMRHARASIKRIDRLKARVKRIEQRLAKLAGK